MRDRGYTLVELLVATAIGALLLTSVLAALYFSSRLMTWIGTRTDVDSSGLLGLAQLSTDLRLASFPSITINQGPFAISLVREDSSTSNVAAFQPETDGNGHTQFTIYYYDAPGQVLVRKTWNQTLNPAGITPTGDLLSSAQLTTVSTTKSGTEHPVASNVQAIICNPPVYPALTPIPGIDVKLQIQATAPNGQTCVETVETMVMPRNHP
ncbi:MAG: PilW family protein [Candidatus Xenobia bacterium]